MQLDKKIRKQIWKSISQIRHWERELNWIWLAKAILGSTGYTEVRRIVQRRERKEKFWAGNCLKTNGPFFQLEKLPKQFTLVQLGIQAQAFSQMIYGKNNFLYILIFPEKRQLCRTQVWLRSRVHWFFIAVIIFVSSMRSKSSFGQKALFW